MSVFYERVLGVLQACVFSDSPPDCTPFHTVCICMVSLLCVSSCAPPCGLSLRILYDKHRTCMGALQCVSLSELSKSKVGEIFSRNTSMDSILSQSVSLLPWPGLLRDLHVFLSRGYLVAVSKRPLVVENCCGPYQVLCLLRLQQQ